MATAWTVTGTIFCYHVDSIHTEPSLSQLLLSGSGAIVTPRQSGDARRPASVAHIKLISAKSRKRQHDPNSLLAEGTFEILRRLRMDLVGAPCPPVPARARDEWLPFLVSSSKHSHDSDEKGTAVRFEHCTGDGKVPLP